MSAASRLTSSSSFYSRDSHWDTYPISMESTLANSQSEEPLTKKISPIYLFAVRVTAVRTGQVEYAMAEARTCNDTITLIFQVSTQIFSKISRYFSAMPTEIDPQANEYVTIIDYLGCKAKDLDKVTKILVDIHLPNSASSADFILTGIGVLCKRNFPNMKPQDSAVHIHYGVTDSRCDSILRKRLT